LLKLISKRKDQLVLVLEDDAKVVNGFSEKLDNVLSELPNEFDLCYLGASADNQQWKVKVKGCNYISHADHQWCLHGIIINKDCVQKIIDRAKTMTGAIDEIFIELQETLNTFASNTYIINQSGSKSDLR
jgi:GR25 family glycosyltransferase involved in LPS biosynthesis